MTIPPEEPAASRPTRSRELREGWSFFWATPWLWTVVLGFGVLNLIHAGAWFTLGPASPTTRSAGRAGATSCPRRQPASWSWRSSCCASGSSGRCCWGMLAIADDGAADARPRRRAHLVALVVAAFIAGAGIEVFGMGWNLAMQENIEDRMLSRAYSYDALGSFVAIPIGQLAWGPLGRGFGFRPRAGGLGRCVRRHRARSSSPPARCATLPRRTAPDSRSRRDG